MILIPGTSHQITWAVQIVQDTTTYYVRAVIRDVRTNTILATLNLDNLGNGRYSKSWNVVQDPTGFGREIEIEKTVYDDSGYTTANGQYGRYLERYTVFNLGTRNPSTGGYGPGSGSQVDYKEISNIIKKHFDEFGKPKEESIDFSPVTLKLDSVLNRLSALETRVTAMEDKDDDTHEEFDSVVKSILSIKNDLKTTIDSSQIELQKNVDKRISSIEAALKNTKPLEKNINNKFESFFKKVGSLIGIENKNLKEHLDKAISKAITPEEKIHNRAKHINRMLGIPSPLDMSERSAQIKRLLS